MSSNLDDFEDFDDLALTGGSGPTLRQCRGGRFGYKQHKVRHITPSQVADASAYGRSASAAGGTCVRIATFMFKGGVYKTMTTILTAAALSAPPFNKRVLIVDGDSQCNATSYFQPEPKNWQEEQEASISPSSPSQPEAGGGNVDLADAVARSKISL